MILPPHEYSREDFLRILVSIDQRLANLERAITDQKYIILNASGVRSLDANSASLEELRQFVGTLAKDFQVARKIP